MFQRKPLAVAIRAAAIGLAASGSVLPAFAAEGDAAANPPAPAVEEIVVTGSRIVRANEVTSSPVVQLDSEQFTFSGNTRVEDVMRSLPQVYMDQDAGQSIEADGTATVQLRNLSPERTLVLIDGKRMPIGSPKATELAPDLNFIPARLVQRAEVLTGGASATYGSDAIAGVVNFTMKDDFEGIELTYQTSAFHHDNNGNVTSTRSQEAGYRSPSGGVTDGDTQDISLIVGGNLAEGRGNVTAYGTYRKIDPITQAARDYSACALGGGRTACGGSPTSAVGNFYFSKTNYFNMINNEFVPVDAANLYNYAPPSYYQRPDERYTAGAFANYDVVEHVTAYTQIMWMHDQTTAQFAPAGLFFDFPVSVRCDNPLLSAQQTTAMGCTAPTDSFDAFIGRRNVEGGPRNGNFKYDTFRGVFGLKGDINEAWRYDAYYMYSQVDMNIRNGNYVNTAKIANALDIVPDGSGNAVCASALSGADPSCVPWNIFQTNGVTPAATSYIAASYYETGNTDQTVTSGYVQGDLGAYGVKMPWADSGVDIILGLEKRDENLKYQPDDASTAGQIGGLNAALVPVSGGYNVKEFYSEASVPIVEGKRFMQEVTLDLGYRYSDYSTGVETDTYKYAGTWAIDNQVKFRASYQRAVRAANILELFQPANGTLFSMSNDPCEKANPTDAVSLSGYTFAQCARTGVDQTVWDAGGPASSPANQYNEIVGGNKNLDPEESDTYSFGVVLNPNFLDNRLTLTIDWYDIKVNDAITEVSGATTLTQCLNGNDQACTLVHRGDNGTLWRGNASLTNGIEAFRVNSGFFEVRGIDFEIHSNWDLPNDWGTLGIDSQSSYVSSWKQEEYPGTTTQSCEGLYGDACETPLPEFRNRAVATWTTPWNVTLNLGWRYVSSVDMVKTVAPSDRVNIDAFHYIDLAGSWNITSYLSFVAGVNNLFDESPPITDNGVTARNNGNTYPGGYDYLGQYWFASLSFRM